MSRSRSKRPEAADVVRALESSAGAWTRENHPDLMRRNGVVPAVRTLRSGFAG
jgi:hypothetical protein